MRGWIKLERAITNHWLWGDEPYTKAQAWLDLLLHANHKPVEILIKGKVVKLERGDQARSEVTLSERWKWSRGKVRRFLKLLKTEQMIEQQTVQHTSVISICNYSKYQDGDNGDGTAGDTPSGTGGGTPGGTQRKNDKNEKKGKKGASSQASRAITFDAWLEKIRESGEKPIPDDHAVIRYAQDAGIPHEFLAVGWEHFKERYSGDSKKYIDWRKVFHNAVRENWFKIWWHDGEGYRLTTVGQQGMNALRNKQRETA